MNLTAVGCSFHTAPVELRERLAIDDSALPRALSELASRYGCEAVIINTCNRVEMYLASTERPLPFDADLIAEFLGESQKVSPTEFRSHFYEQRDAGAVGHLFRVASSLDSLVVGEGQIAGQIKRAFELAKELATTGPVLNALFKHAMQTAKRVRTETGISQGHLSVSSVAVDCLKQVFDHFGDKVALVIGAGEMGQETLKNLLELKPGTLWVTNRSYEKAVRVAEEFRGRAIPWEELDDALTKADIVVSTTGAAEPVVTRERYDRVIGKRTSGTQVILDIAVPRDFERSVGEVEGTFLFNIDDLQKVIEESAARRRKHIAPAERIVEEETRKFAEDWSRRKNGPLIQRLKQECDDKREAILTPLLGRLNGKLSDEDRKYIEGAFKLFQNQLLHAPIAVVGEEAKEGASGTLRDALRKLFRLEG